VQTGRGSHHTSKHTFVRLQYAVLKRLLTHSASRSPSRSPRRCHQLCHRRSDIPRVSPRPTPRRPSRQDPNFHLSYEGFSPSSSPKTIQRQWPDYNPTMSVNDKKVMCNGGTSADLSAKVAAGGKIRANWKQWTHEQGPVMVWMYKCSGDFKSCDGSGKKWFKVHISSSLIHLDLLLTLLARSTKKV